MLKITVVIPANNRARTLPACLESVLVQTFPPDEIIVVDDASTDNTMKVVERYHNRGVVYAHLPRGKGAQAARNYGVQIASNDWIAFQDSDDLWLGHKLAVQVGALRERGFAKDVVVHSNGLKRNESTGEETIMAVKPTVGRCYAQLLLNPAPMFPSMLVSKEAVMTVGGLDDNCLAYQEWDTAIRLATYCEFIHIYDPLFKWVWHSGETISKDQRRAILGYNYVLDQHRVEIIEHYGMNVWRKQKLGVVSQALRANLWNDVQNMLVDEGYHRSFLLARFFSHLRFGPRGVGMLLRLASN